MSQNTGTRIEEVRTVSIPVSDVDRALDFYTTELGFEVRLDVPFGDGRRWIEVAAPGAITSIALAPPGPGQSPGVDTGIRFTTADVEADHAGLKARGVDVDAEVLRWPNSPPMFQLRDPDGNLLRVIQRAEERPWQEADEQPAEACAWQPGKTGGGQTEAATKRFVVFVKSDAATESGAMPDEGSLDAMTRFNDELADAGLLLAGEGLHASTDGARIRYSGDSTTVTRGPFPDPRQLVAGYWMIQASSLDEAIAWMKRAPMGGDAEVEIRQVLDAEEFGDALTPEIREREERQRARMEANAKRRAA
jgi:catechol 2,3-dioxygenase-like lactoylglutathione lyase family enzyme